MKIAGKTLESRKKKREGRQLTKLQKIEKRKEKEENRKIMKNFRKYWYKRKNRIFNSSNI